MINRPSFHSDRRRFPRHRVNGFIVFKDNKRSYSAQPLDISLGGMLFLMNDAPPDGTEMTAEVDVVGFRETIAVRIRKIRTYQNLSAAVFLSTPASLERCIEWLSGRETVEATLVAVELEA